MATVNGFHLVKNSDGSEVQRWPVVPARIEVFDGAGNTLLRVDGAKEGFTDGSYMVSPTTWVEADPPPSTIARWESVVSRFTDTEWAAVQRTINNQVAAGNGALARWLTLSVINGIDMTAAQTATYKAQLVAAGILTQARADAIFVV